MPIDTTALKRAGVSGTCDLNSEGKLSNMGKTRQVRLARRSSGYWRVTFDIPPLNIFGPETIPQLNEIVTALETDEQVIGRFR